MWWYAITAGVAAVAASGGAALTYALTTTSNERALHTIYVKSLLTSPQATTTNTTVHITLINETEPRIDRELDYERHAFGTIVSIIKDSAISSFPVQAIVRWRWRDHWFQMRCVISDENDSRRVCYYSETEWSAMVYQPCPFTVITVKNEDGTLVDATQFVRELAGPRGDFFNDANSLLQKLSWQFEDGKSVSLIGRNGTAINLALL